MRESQLFMKSFSHLITFKIKSYRTFFQLCSFIPNMRAHFFCKTPIRESGNATKSKADDIQANIKEGEKSNLKILRSKNAHTLGLFLARRAKIYFSQLERHVEV